MAAIAGMALAASADIVRADDPEASLAQFFDGMDNRDYPKAMQGILAIVALDQRPPARGQADCFAALREAVAARAKTACDAFASASGSDPRAHVGVALADIVGERPLDAVGALDDALKIDPRNLPANFLRRFLAEGGAGAVGDGWAAPSLSAAATLASGLQQFEGGDFRAAARSFKTLVDAGQVHGNVPLMLYISRKRAGLPTGNELDPMLDVGGPRYRMLIPALRGESTPKAALRTFQETWGEDDGDYAADRFFLGEAALLQGDKTEAKRYFSKAVAVKQETTEIRLARAELTRLP